VKICGITTPHDALLAQAAGADAIGMIFAPRSSRLVSPEQAAAISAAVGPFISTVGVFVDADLDLVERLIDELRLDAVQLHGAESPEYAASLAPRTKVVRALTFSAAPTPAAVAAYPADAFLLDGAVPGSGTVFDWSRAAAWRGHPRLVLAGGLTPDNVAEAIAALRPYAVDVASGVESAPRSKDAGAIQRFVAEARRAFE
jgi:phosphoribosylanthranilate isomerase